MRLLTIGLLTILAAMPLSQAALAAPSASATDEASSVVAVLENVIRWSTESEVNNFGYDVFRGLAEEGPFERLNESTVPGHGTTDVPQKYEYRDTSIAADTSYWYYVESISMQGEREKFTPVFRSKPKTLK